MTFIALFWVASIAVEFISFSFSALAILFSNSLFCNYRLEHCCFSSDIWDSASFCVCCTDIMDSWRSVILNLFCCSVSCFSFNVFERQSICSESCYNNCLFFSFCYCCCMFSAVSCFTSFYDARRSDCSFRVDTICCSACSSLTCMSLFIKFRSVMLFLLESSSFAVAFKLCVSVVTDSSSCLHFSCDCSNCVVCLRSSCS